jgi:hypothetical protein
MEVCTHCTCKATKKKGYFTLTHFDREHKGDWKAKKAEANLTRIEDDPSGKILLGPPLLTTLAPSDSDNVEDEDEMTFTGAWFTPAVPVDDSNDGDCSFPEVYCCPTESEPPALIDVTPLSTDEEEMEVVHRSKYHSWKKNKYKLDIVMLKANTEKKDVWSEEVNCDEIKNYINCSYWEKLTMLQFLWVTMMGVAWGFAASAYAALIQPQWDMIAIPLFLWASLGWDTLSYLVGSPSKPILPSRHVRRAVIRHKRSRNLGRSLFFGCVTWAVLMGSILIPTAAFTGPDHPFLVMGRQVQGARNRIERLNEAVELTPSTFWQFQVLEIKKLLKETQEKTKNEAHGCDYELIDEKEFFDAHEILRVYHGGEFFDCLDESDFEIHEGRDLLRMNAIYKDIISIDCKRGTCGTFSVKEPTDIHSNGSPVLVLEAKLAPSDIAISLLVGETILCPVANLAGQKWLITVIFDTGASLSITHDLGDFVDPPKPLARPMRLGGFSNCTKIEGIGIVAWTFTGKDGTEVKLLVEAYYVPTSKQRLMSPQTLLCKENGIFGSYSGDEEKFELKLNDQAVISIPYDKRSSLPIAEVLVGPEPEPTVNLTGILDDSNHNLTGGQKLLLVLTSTFKLCKVCSEESHLWQKYLLQQSNVILLSVNCANWLKQKEEQRRLKQQKNPERDGALKADHLSPGLRVSVDHFECRQRGRTCDSHVKSTSKQYVGGCIFVDHASYYVHVEHQFGLSDVETIRAKQAYECKYMDNGIFFQDYLTDSGAFKANDFVKHINETHQLIRFCGTNAHHQNGVAERSIQIISNMARSMILHDSIHWKDGIDASVWPQAVAYAAHIYNNTPKDGVCPAYIFTVSAVPRHHLMDLHVWGCPLYVLDPKIQQGKKLPRWEPRSKRGMFLGLSQQHAREVPLVLNLGTGSITTQFHVVFDDLFTTVPSIERDTAPPDHWEELCHENSSHIMLDSPPEHSNDEWLTEEDLETKRRHINRDERIREATEQRYGGASVNHPLGNPTSTEAPSQEIHSQTPVTHQVTAPSASASFEPTTSTEVANAPTEGALSSPAGPQLRRSTRSTAGNFQTARYADAFLARVEDYGDQSNYSQMAYLSELQTDWDEGTVNISDPRVYSAKKTTDADNPNFHEAMHGDHQEQYLEAMKIEVASLLQQRTWKTTPHSEVGRVLKFTWVFKFKRLPDGTPSKFKARFCVRGDLQKEGIDFFETYAPVYQWSTVRMILTMVLQNGWATKQVDCTNAFAQAKMKETVYIEAPKLYGPKSGKDSVVLLLKSLYGIKQAPRTFYEKFRDGILERGFTQSEIDPCLFMKKDCMCVVYVDDTIFAGPDALLLEREIKSLGVKE